MIVSPKRLRRLRETHSRPVRTMNTTSELMGLNRDALRRYEQGKAEPTLEALVKIADYYEVSADYLLGRSDIRDWKR